MQTIELVANLKVMGFVDADKVKDFGEGLLPCLQHDVYLSRLFSKQYQYVYLCTTSEGKFLEAVFSVYAQPFNSRAKPAQVPLFATLYRNQAELENAVKVVYQTKKA